MNASGPISARQRFWRLLRLTLAAAVAGVGAVFAWLVLTGEPVTLHYFVAIGLGVGASILLAGLLMGLVFLSNRSGHDAAVGHDEEDLR